MLGVSAYQALFALAILFIMNVQVFNRGFALITAIPEKAGKFIGGGEEMLGDSQGVSSGKGTFVAVGASTKAGITEAAKAAAGSGNKNAQEGGQGGEPPMSAADQRQAHIQQSRQARKLNKRLP